MRVFAFCQAYLRSGEATCRIGKHRGHSYSITNVTHRLRLSLLAAALVLPFGCNRDRDNGTVQSYSAPKESQPPAVASNDQAMPAQGGDASAAQQGTPIEWKVPSGWKQLPGGNEMRFASFQVGDDPQAVVTVVPLPSAARALLPNVQRWAGQLHLAEVTEADLPRYVTRTQVSGEQADIVDMTSPAEAGKEPTRLLAAIVPHEDRAWFFKLMAPAPVVAAQKSNFEQFVHSVQFPTGQSGPTVTQNTPPPEHGASAESFRLAQWKTPQGWEEQPGSNAMRVTSFRVGSGDQSAEVIISRIPQGQSGSMLDNVNRWRGQVGLGPISDPKEAGFQYPQVAGGPGLFLSYTGPKAGAAPAKQVLVAMTVKGRDDWYIKMIGPEPVVSTQADAFKQFVNSLQFTPESK